MISQQFTESDLDWGILENVPESDRETLISIILDLINASMELLMEYITGITLSPTYRTTPIKGAELGGAPHNPEDHVIDEIDRLVEWQMKNGETGGW